MKLALETSTDVCSVVFYDDSGNMHEKRTAERGSHSESLFLFTEELMSEHHFNIGDLEAVLISGGPGSYTGLRIGASAVKGLLFETSVPLFAVHTLASFAASAVHENGNLEKIHSIIDARRMHVYHHCFRFAEGTLFSQEKTEVIPIDRFENMVKPGDAVIGTGLDRLDKKIVERDVTFGSGHISASSLIRLSPLDPDGKFHSRVDPQEFEPRYYSAGQV